MNPVVEKLKSVIPQIDENIGSAAVDFSELRGNFGNVDQAISFVQRFAPQLLQSVAYIYNYSEGGSFGMFDPSLNASIHVERVRQEMESQGYETTYEEDPVSHQSKLYAYSPAKDAEEVKSEMERIYKEKIRDGGVAIGLDISAILESSREMYDNIKDIPVEDIQLNDLTSRIVGEGADEQEAYGVQFNIVSRALEEILKTKGENFSVQDVTAAQVASIIAHEGVHAIQAREGKTKGWYKKAQLDIPFQWVLIEPILRRNQDWWEKRHPIDRDKDDSVETTLIKNVHEGDNGLDVTEKLLKEKDHTENDEDKPQTIEQKLVEKRVHPLIIPIPSRAASTTKIDKTAGINSNLGGPYINIDSWFAIDQGIERVFPGTEIGDNGGQASDFKGEDISSEGMYWRKLRYNPMFQRTNLGKDRFGRPTYNWEASIHMDFQRNDPQTWDQAFRENPFIAPWNRAAQTIQSVPDQNENNYKNGIIRALRRIGYYKDMVESGKRPAVRLIVEGSLLQEVSRALIGSNIIVFDVGSDNAVWIFGENADPDKIPQMEANISLHQNMDEVNKFVGLEEEIRERINYIFGKCRILAQEHGLHDVYVVGGFCRTLASTKDMLEVNDLDFSSASGENALKLGWLLATDLGIKDVITRHRTMTISFEYEGVSMDFRGTFVPVPAIELMRSNGISVTPLHYDVYSRDFTVNSLLYSFETNKIYDVTGEGLHDLNDRVLKTHFQPESVVRYNPLIITRAVIMNLRGYKINPDLDQVIKRSVSLLFSGQYSDKRLAYECLKIQGYGEDGEYMMREYGLQKLCQIKDKLEQEQPELFEDME